MIVMIIVYSNHRKLIQLGHCYLNLVSWIVASIFIFYTTCVRICVQSFCLYVYMHVRVISMKIARVCVCVVHEYVCMYVVFFITMKSMLLTHLICYYCHACTLCAHTHISYFFVFYFHFFLLLTLWREIYLLRTFTSSLKEKQIEQKSYK